MFLNPSQIGDYGLAEERHSDDYISVDMDSQEKQHLPLRWLAPELRERILGSEPILSDIGVSPSESLWSLGITIWEVATLSQHLPFRQVTDQAFQTLTSFIGTELLGQIELQVIGTIPILRQHNFGFFSDTSNHYVSINTVY